MPQPPIRAKRTKARPDEYLNAIPNRDLTGEDWDALDTEQRALVRSSDLYEVLTDAEFKALTDKDKADAAPTAPTAAPATAPRADASTVAAAVAETRKEGE